MAHVLCDTQIYTGIEGKYDICACPVNNHFYALEHTGKLHTNCEDDDIVKSGYVWTHL